MDFCQTSQAEILARQPDPALWLPRLDQLLAEIYARGYEYSLHGPNNNYLDLPKTPWIAISKKQDAWIFDADTPDEAAAEALLWILSQKEA